jgi:integrase
MRTINKGKTPSPSEGRPSAAKIISTSLQAGNAGPGVHKTSATGLYLKVGQTGAGSYFWRYRLGELRREIGLGSRDRVKLAEARAAASEADALRRKGVDPIDERRRKRAEALAQALAGQPLRFREAAEAYLKDHAPHWKHKYASAVWLNPLVKFAFPLIGGLELDRIELSHVIAVMEAAEEADAAETARRVRARIERVINSAMARGRCDSARRNPADGKLIAAARPSKRKGERPHYRAVDLNDAPKVFQELKARAETHSAFAAWCFMIACAARPSEALNAKWAEIDLVKHLWTLSPERMKSCRQHIVPLSSAALAVLERQARVRAGEAVFPARSGSPLNYNSFATAPAKAGIHAACPHGWRSVFRDWAGDIGEISRDLAEAALAHSVSATEGAYRRLTAVERRRAVMEAYARWLDNDNAEVVASRQAKPPDSVPMRMHEEPFSTPFLP